MKKVWLGSIAPVSCLFVAALTTHLQADQISLTPASVIGGTGAWNTNNWDAGQFNAGNVADHQSESAIDEPDQSPGDANGGFWLGKELDEEEFLVIDLGQDYILERIDLFQSHNAQFDDRSTNGYEIYGSQAVAPLVSGETGAGGNDLVDGVLIGSGSLTRQLMADDPIEPESPALTESGPYRYLRVSTVGPFHDVPGTPQRSVGLNEIRVFGIVPEPSSMLLALFAVAYGLGIGVRRRWNMGRR